MLDINDAVDCKLVEVGTQRGGAYVSRRTLYCFLCVSCKGKLWYRKEDAKKMSGYCFKCRYGKEKVGMYGTRYDNPVITPDVLWFMASIKRRETWLYSRGFKKTWAMLKFKDLPLYISNKWEDESEASE